MDSLVFLLDQQQYALPVEHVREVVLLPALVRLAGAPRHIRGMLNLRGHYIPVLDARVLIGGAGADRLDNQILILGPDEDHAPPALGLLVDQVSAVRWWAAPRLADLPGDAAAPFLCGVLADGEDAIIVMDAPALINLAGPHTDRNDNDHTC